VICIQDKTIKQIERLARDMCKEYKTLSDLLEVAKKDLSDDPDCEVCVARVEELSAVLSLLRSDADRFVSNVNDAVAFLTKKEGS